MSRRDEDLALLRRLVYWGEEQDPEPDWVSPFERMILDLEAEKWPELTERQRAWVKGVTERVFDEPEYLNLVSAGKVPRGLREVPTPAVLQNLPLKPPRRS